MTSKDKINNLIDMYNYENPLKTQQACKELLTEYPKSFIIINILGATLLKTNKLEEALNNFNKAIQLNPNFIEAYNNRGNVFTELGRWNEALNNFNKAIQLNPNFIEAYNNRGNVLLKIWKLEEALNNFNKAIQLNPNFIEAYNNRGNVFTELGRWNEALNNFNKAIQLNPNFIEAYNNRGSVFIELGRWDEAIIDLNKCIDLRPNHAEAYYNFSKVFTELGRLDEAVKYYEKAIELKPDYEKAYSNLLLILNYINLYDCNHLNSLARKFGYIASKKVKTFFSNYKCNLSPKKLRIGLVSGDFRNHPVGYFLEGTLSKIDSSYIELFAYSTNFENDDLTNRIKSYFSSWTTLYNKNDKDAAKQIFNDGINILVDLSGHTAKNRLSLFAWKPAPVQVSWLGYFATTGLKEMDYLIGDPYVTPPGNDNLYTEKIWRLPEIRMCFTPPTIDIKVSELPALKNGYITFGCFNNLLKINDEVISLWSKVLKTIPRSKIFFKTKKLKETFSKKKLIEKFSSFGISNERIIIEEHESREKYLIAYNKVDIALDPFPFTGGTISIEALWMGVPLLTLAGKSFVSRQGLEILMNIGLKEWIAYDQEDYLLKASNFVKHIKTLELLRVNLRKQVLTSSLCDTGKFSKNLEKAFWEIWHESKKNIL